MAIFDAVFSGGGTKGVAYAGALEVLETSGHRIGRVIGTSAGAITAALVAAGYTAKELLAASQEKVNGKPAFYAFLAPPDAREMLPIVKRPNSETRSLMEQALDRTIDKSIDNLGNRNEPLKLTLKTAFLVSRMSLYQDAFDHFADELVVDSPFVTTFFSFLERGGFFSTEKFVDWFRDRLRFKIKSFENGLNLKTLYDVTGRDLSIVVADTAEKKLLVLNYRTAPLCPVVQAVRMSMSIPLVWQEVVWQEKWGTYLGQPKAGHSIVDGGALSNFPIRWFLKWDEPEVKRVMGNPVLPGNKLVGFMLDDTLAVPGDIEPDRTWESKTIGRVGRLLDTVTGWDNEYVQQAQGEVCRIPCKGYNALEFAMTGERLGILLNSGRCAMTDHLKARGLGR